MANEIGEWNARLMHNVAPRRIINKLHVIVPRSHKDVLLLNREPIIGNLSVTSAYFLLTGFDLVG